MPVGAFSSKSRFTTAQSCSSVSRREKSISGKKFEGSASRPWRLTTKGFKGTSLHTSLRICREGPLSAPRVLKLRLSSPQYELKSVSLLTGSNHRFGRLVRNVRCDTVVQSCSPQ